MADKKASVKDIKDFFGMTLGDMKKEWTGGHLTEKDKAELSQGIGDGSLTY